jgi:hypothetical protein
VSKKLSVSRVFSKAGYEPHVGQIGMHNAMAENRFRVVCAGRRTGKSTAGGHELLLPAYQAYFNRNNLDKHDKRMEYWIVGPEYTDAEKEFRVLWNDCKQLDFPIDKPGSYNDPNNGNMHLSLWDGKFQVHAKSAKYPESLVGEGLHGVILAEAAKLKPSVWTKYLRPTLADFRGWALMTSTPEGKNWFYEQWQHGQQGLPGWWSSRMPSWTNNILFPGGRTDPEILSMEAELTQETFNQEVGAEFTEFVGRVFKNFDEEIHCRPLTFSQSSGMQTFGACDYGWTNPFVWLLIQVDLWGNVYVLNEFYQSHMRIDEIPAELQKLGLVPPQMRSFYPDPAEPGDSRIMEEKLKIKAEGGTGGELKERLRLIRQHLDINPEVVHLHEGHPERLPRLFIDSAKCPNLVREMNDYRYPENKSERNEQEAPMKKDDHAPEALGRFFAGYFGNRQPTGRTRIRTSTMAA